VVGGPAGIGCRTKPAGHAARIVGSWVASAGAASKPVLRVLVTNDDGYAAPGIDAVVQALRALPRTSVVVVAPATNESGIGGKTTPGTITASAARTASGYPA
jgi:5'-nucleotidase